MATTVATTAATPLTPPTPMETFLARGGQLHQVDPSKKEAQVLLSPDTVLYPCCLQASNRSQVLYKVLQDMREGNISCLNLPHGFETGYDPWKRYEGLTPDNWFEYLCDGAVNTDADPIHPCFKQAFGVPKRPKFGQPYVEAKQKFEKNQYAQQKQPAPPLWFPLNRDDFCIIPLTTIEQNRKMMYQFFNLDFYGPALFEKNPTRRHLFFAFDRGVDMLLNRLNQMKDGSFKQVTIVSMPYDDEASKAMKCYKDIVKTQNLPPTTTRTEVVATAYRRVYHQFQDVIRLNTTENRRLFPTALVV